MFLFYIGMIRRNYLEISLLFTKRRFEKTTLCKGFLFLCIHVENYHLFLNFDIKAKFFGANKFERIFCFLNQQCN